MGTSLGPPAPSYRCSLPAVPPSLRGIAKPNLKKRKWLRLPRAGASRRGGSTVSAGRAQRDRPPRCQGVRRRFSFLPSPVPPHRQPTAELQVRPPPRQAPGRAALLSSPPRRPTDSARPTAASQPRSEGRGCLCAVPRGVAVPNKGANGLCRLCAVLCRHRAGRFLPGRVRCPLRLRDLVTQRREAASPADAGQRCQGVIAPRLSSPGLYRGHKPGQGRGGGGWHSQFWGLGSPLKRLAILVPTPPSAR